MDKEKIKKRVEKFKTKASVRKEINNLYDDLYSNTMMLTDEDKSEINYEISLLEKRLIKIKGSKTTGISQIKKEVENKEVEFNEEAKQILDNFDKIDYSIGLEIKELRECPLHDFLRQNKLYQHFYSLFRIRFRGNYTWIAPLFILFIQSYSTSVGKFKMNDTDEYSKRINIYGYKASGGGKTALCKFVVNLLEFLDVPAISTVNPGTEANLRGTVMTSNDNVTVTAGAMGCSLVAFEELKTILAAVSKDDKLQGFLLGLLENTWVDSGTASANSLVARYREQCEDEKKEKISEQVEQVEQLETKSLTTLDDGMNLPDVEVKKKPKYNGRPKDKIKLELETDTYKVSTYKGEVTAQSKMFFKNNANCIIMSQPIFASSSRLEREMQQKFMWETGAQYRGIFLHDVDRVTKEKETEYKIQRTTFINQLKNIFDVETGKDAAKILREKMKTLLEELPEMPMYIKYDEVIDAMSSNFDKWSPTWKTITDDLSTAVENGVDSGEIKYMTSYKQRTEFVNIPVMTDILAYIKGVTSPDSEMWKVATMYCAKTLQSFKDYLANTGESTVFSKEAQMKNYSPIILKTLTSLINKSRRNNKDIVDEYYHYPSLTLFNKKAETEIKLKVSDKFDKGLYTKTINTLIEAEKIDVTNTNPSNGDKFRHNTKKVIYKGVLK